ncbi:MAG: hypothetical protein A2X47_13830 [Lentisphaerae bacterium GWF2_38_69]|nr:MAG: hypothetical protein A2X47_13830 [Lentisphaerae bacterium GWF2_38_69]
MESNENKLPDRRHPVHWHYIDKLGRPNIIYVTVCSKDRKKIFANDIVHLNLVSAWKLAGDWLVGKYMIMPDHIHFFCSPSSTNISHSLADWIKYWKSLVSLKWHKADERPLWQREFWDRQLRKGDSYSRKWEYVNLNPLRHKLIDENGVWPYQGELNVFRW